MGPSDKHKIESIRELLLKTVGKNPDLFSYYVAIQEAKELLGKPKPECDVLNKPKDIKKLGEG